MDVSYDKFLWPRDTDLHSHFMLRIRNSNFCSFTEEAACERTLESSAPEKVQAGRR